MAPTLIPALGRQRQVNLCEFEASLVYRVSSRIARATQKNSFTKKQTTTTKKASDNLGKDNWHLSSFFPYF